MINRIVYIRRLIFQGEEPVLLHREHLIYDPTRPIIQGEMEVTALRRLFSGGGESDLKRGDLTIARLPTFGCQPGRIRDHHCPEFAL